MKNLLIPLLLLFMSFCLVAAAVYVSRQLEKKIKKDKKLKRKIYGNVTITEG